MREIQFRGKRIDNDAWIYGAYVEVENRKTKEKCCAIFEYYDDGNDSEVIPDTVGQYTGLKDKAGTKAFEHDCIRQVHGDAIGVIRYGVYNNTFDGDEYNHVGFHVDWGYGEDKDFLRKDLCYWLNCVEVIGNIHDNPELLKGG